ncbi:MAG: hypothetical protein REI45_15860, partial [Propionicimonas sp.]|nr:hypothetical protein [Propionicimonas sp.]
RLVADRDDAGRSVVDGAALAAHAQQLAAGAAEDGGGGSSARNRFVGLVTAETSSLVSPAGITTLDFGDPLVALNRVAGQLSDGDASNGEAEVVIALLHDGSNSTDCTAI